jgi:hypothetical protein
MALEVVEQYTCGSETLGTAPQVPAFVCLRSTLSLDKQIGELTDVAAKHLAIQVAQARGVSDARINGFSSATTPVDANGVPITDPKNQKIDRYHIDIPVCGRLV